MSSSTDTRTNNKPEMNATTPQTSRSLSTQQDNDSIYPDYEINSSVTLDEAFPLIFVYGMVFLVGVTGNCMVLVSVCQFRRMRSVINQFLLSLASADLLLLLVCVPVKVSRSTKISFNLHFQVQLVFIHVDWISSIMCS